MQERVKTFFFIPLLIFVYDIYVNAKQLRTDCLYCFAFGGNSERDCRGKFQITRGLLQKTRTREDFRPSKAKIMRQRLVGAKRAGEMSLSNSPTMESRLAVHFTNINLSHRNPSNFAKTNRIGYISYSSVTSQKRQLINFFSFKFPAFYVIQVILRRIIYQDYLRNASYINKFLE